MFVTSYLIGIWLLMISVAEATDSDYHGRNQSDIDTELSRSRRLLLKPAYLWPKAVVPYTIEYSALRWKHEIERVIAHIEDQSCIRFPIYSVVNKRKYDLHHYAKIAFFKGDGCFSGVGFSQRGVRTSCCTGEACLHEIGHALGFSHEQNSGKRVGWIDVNEAFIPDGERQKYAETDDAMYDYNRPYDISTMMHYFPVEFTKGKPAYSKDFPELPIAQQYFYHFKEMADGYKCHEKPQCQGRDLGCDNEGYQTIQHGVCKCVCPTGLDPDNQCKSPLTKVTSASWPKGQYAFLKPKTGCPTGGEFKEGNIVQYGAEGNSMYNSHLAGIVKDVMTELYFCTRTKTDGGFESEDAAKFNWPMGTYCMFRTGGHCPIGFNPHSINYTSNLHADNGDVPDIQLGRMTFCCQFRGFQKEPASFPADKPFTLVGYPRTKCQKVTGMRSHRESFTIVSSKTITADNLLHRWLNYGFKGFTVPVCHYIPVDMNCGGTITLSKGVPLAYFEMSGDRRTNLECTWVIKGDTDQGTMVLDFEEFNVTKKEGSKECEDKVEVRHAMIGQFGLDYCGKVEHSIRSITDKMMVRFFTHGKSSSSFKAKVKWVPFDEMCYGERGVSYDGNVNYTRMFEPCLPWAEMKECPHNPYFSKHDELNKHLSGNACRNPDKSFRPWCYTSKEGCQRNYCDVCGLETPYDHYDNCKKLKARGFCTRDSKNAIKYCAATCQGQLPTKPSTKIYSDITCVQREIPIDGAFIGNGQLNYKAGETVQFRCRDGSNVVSSMCMTSGTWSEADRACRVCPPNYIQHKDKCFGLPEHSGANIYANANGFCRKEGGYVAAPRDRDEELIIAKLTKFQYTWIGISDKKKEGEWIYDDDGSPVTRQNWAPSEPNNINNEDCAALQSNTKWLDINCYYRYHFVCSIKKWASPADCHDSMGEKFCLGLISDKPTLCKDLPDFVKENCQRSCGICSTKRVMCPVMARLKPHVEVAGTLNSPALQVGETIEYRCGDSKYPIGGNKIRACLPSGKLTGESLECADCPSGYTMVDNACHGLLEGRSLTFYEAQAECKKLDGFVAMPRTDEENAIIRKIGMGQKIWIGVTDIYTEKSFMMEDGSSAFYYLWTSGEPKMKGDAYDCVLMNELGNWVNVDCDKDIKLTTVCTILTSDDDKCYDMMDGGRSYDGNVNYTRLFQPCVPWSEVANCPSHAFSKGLSDYTEPANLVGNACRNPDKSYRPWCYTRAEGCVRNYCDVCGSVTPKDKRDDCAMFKSEGLCTRDAVKALQECAATCINDMPTGKQMAELPDIHCGRPTPPSDAATQGPLKSQYNVGDTVEYICIYADWSAFTRCMTSGQWSQVGYACPECADGFTAHGDTCYMVQERKVDYMTAITECKNKGAHVAVPTNKEESDYISKLTERMTWVGLSDDKKEGTWIYLNGTQAKWTNWFRGQPGNRATYNCVYKMTGASKWFDVPCTYKRSYVCSAPVRESRTCDDFLKDHCTKLLSEEPKMCEKYPDFSRQKCGKTCGYCDSSEKKCDLPKVGAHVVQTSESKDISTGDYVEYACSTNTYRIGGNKVRTCMPDGNFTGEPLQCGDCPAGFTLVANSCFKAVEGQILTFVEAQKECNKMGGFVAMPKSIAENDVVSKLGDGKFTWIGATDREREGLYQWEDGTMINWINWAAGQADSERNDCVGVNQKKKWAHITCEFRLRTVCSIPLEGRKCKHAYNGVCYNLLLGGKSLHQDEAVSACDVLGGTVAAPRNEDEAKYIKQVLLHTSSLPKPVVRGSTWLGIDDKKQEGTWTYQDGSKIQWANWREGEPNDEWMSGENCAVMIDLEWIDVPCGFRKYPAVCAVKQRIPDSEIQCDQPVPPSDAVLESEAKSKYSVGDTVEFKCKSGGFQVFSRCMTNHQWSDSGFACLSCPGTFFQGRCYMHVNKPFNYEGASAYCKKANAYLVAPRSQVEADFVAKMMTGSMLWIGITDKTSEGDWVYEDGSKLVWTNWNPGEPNNYGKDEEDCAIMVYHTRWIDVQCKYYYQGAICVRDATEP